MIQESRLLARKQVWVDQYIANVWPDQLNLVNSVKEKKTIEGHNPMQMVTAFQFLYVDKTQIERKKFRISDSYSSMTVL